VEKVGVQALWVLLVVWLYFLAKYFLNLRVPALLNTAIIIVGVAAAIGVFIWLTRQSRHLWDCYNARVDRITDRQ
jgi:hypothetical protein